MGLTERFRESVALMMLPYGWCVERLRPYRFNDRLACRLFIRVHVCCNPETQQLGFGTLKFHVRGVSEGGGATCRTSWCTEVRWRHGDAVACSTKWIKVESVFSASVPRVENDVDFQVPCEALRNWICVGQGGRCTWRIRQRVRLINLDLTTTGGDPNRTISDFRRIRN